MGQYHYVANLDKREFIHPHRLGDGLKLMEFGSSSDGTMLGLALLLAVSNGRGGGDYHEPSEMTPEDTQLIKAVIGRWGGDRIAIIGDYYEQDDLSQVDLTTAEGNPWVDEGGAWSDISLSVRRVLELDTYTTPRESWGGSDLEGDPYQIV